MKRVLLAALALAVFAVVPVSATAPPTCLGENVNDRRATDADDFLTGTNDADVIALGLGSDQYFAVAGADVICGNDGNDVVVGEDGADRLNGGTGDDIVAGLGAGDLINGNAGADEVKGGAGDDAIRAGDDAVEDHLYDGPGNDVIIGDTLDVWFRCADDVGDNHDNFAGLIIPDPDC